MLWNVNQFLQITHNHPNHPSHPSHPNCPKKYPGSHGFGREIIVSHQDDHGIGGVYLHLWPLGRLSGGSSPGMGRWVRKSKDGILGFNHGLLNMIIT